ncbi:MTRF1L release factor glutamine methyltransferase [Microcaecilia unicolor]|uniref:peptide chain release factor N(5)-glutamine methyltransferase n=1 Tax=Microcaecilia unicolor TaxID=1415580 RepID=A0A6P7YDP9_9AMPH|nr:MTRF1L release factor glutamine methyltransferase [Microcaecilia unicolor]XP_030063072.1 MTRF1L release factor glutamine methyltransferase [Microcaecilia unicolor]
MRSLLVSFSRILFSFLNPHGSLKLSPASKVHQLTLVKQRSSSTELPMPTDLVNYWQGVFEAQGVPEARASSEYIVSYVLEAKTFQSLRADHLSKPVTVQQLFRVQELSAQRLNRMPIQYIIGEWDFLDLTLMMRPPVFIPRPETELLVALVIEEFQRKMKPRGAEHRDLAAAEASQYPMILEVGCGSGAISLSLLKKFPKSHIVAVDKEEAAVSLTRDNAIRLRLQDRITILQHDILANHSFLLHHNPVDIIVSNPPYIFKDDIASLAPEILSYEDPTALDGGEDGMQIITGILSNTPHFLKLYGDVFLEVDPRHPEMVAEWLRIHPDLHLCVIATHKDFCGKPRFLHLQKG